MKNFIATFSILSTFCIILFSCETDEPPNIKQDISGVWVLSELYSTTYQNDTEIIYEADIPVYSEEIEFLPEGLYIVGSDIDPAFNEQLAFAFAGNLQNYNNDSTYNEVDDISTKIFGTWETHINVDGDNILHFDKYVNGEDSYMFLDHVDENSLTMTMVVNQYYSDININNFEYLAKYQATWDVQLYTEYYFNEGFAYEDGYDVGEIIGYYDGYYDHYDAAYSDVAEDDLSAEEFYIFSLFYGSTYADTFFENYDPSLADIDFDYGLLDGYDAGYIIGENEAIQHDNGKAKSVILTYKLIRK